MDHQEHLHFKTVLEAEAARDSLAALQRELADISPNDTMPEDLIPDDKEVLGQILAVEEAARKKLITVDPALMQYLHDSLLPVLEVPYQDYGVDPESTIVSRKEVEQADRNRRTTRYTIGSVRERLARLL